MPDQILLRLHQVSRRLAGRLVVEKLDLSLDRGAVLGLLGVNGAGKSTTLRMICGVLAPSSGEVIIAGHDVRDDPRAAAAILGYLPEQPPLYPELRVDEYLAFCARLRRLSGAKLATAVESVIERCGLGDVRRRLLGNLSKGFQQRAGIAQAIVHDPALIVLDEPASGLDPLQSANIRALIRELGKDHGVILSTHLIADVTQCCDRVAVLHRGKLRYDGPVRAMADEHAYSIRVVAMPKVTEWSALEGVESAEWNDPLWNIQLRPDVSPARLSQAIVAKDWGLLELRAHEASLEQIFLRIASADDTQAAA